MFPCSIRQILREVTETRFLTAAIFNPEKSEISRIYLEFSFNGTWLEFRHCRFCCRAPKIYFHSQRVPKTSIFHSYPLPGVFPCSIRQIWPKPSGARFLTAAIFGQSRKIPKIPKFPGFTWSFHLNLDFSNFEIFRKNVFVLVDFFLSKNQNFQNTFYFSFCCYYVLAVSNFQVRGPVRNRSAVSPKKATFKNFHFGGVSFVIRLTSGPRS